MELNLIAKQFPLLGGQSYICGPTGFMRYAKQQLLSLGLPAQAPI
ncbi:hypothetical protein [Bowmanella denitrificans]|nr:hypothetical protein [Bowmanella denitrificans]